MHNEVEINKSSSDKNKQGIYNQNSELANQSYGHVDGG